MNKIVLIIGLCCLNLFFAGAENNVQKVLSEIEKNNQLLRAYHAQIEARQLNDRADNNLSDPEVEIEQVYASEKKMGRESEVTVSQGFDFPTVYVMRGKLNKAKSETYGLQLAIDRTAVLLEAKELCYDLIYLEKQKKWLDQRMKNVEQMERLFRIALEEGDVTMIDCDKLKLETINIRTEIMQNNVQRKAKLKALQVLNGGIAIDFRGDEYDEVPQSRSLNELVAHDQRVQLAEKEHAVVEREVKLARSEWLPEISLGYKYNNGDSEQFNGFVAGFTIPLFANAKRVKAAKSESVASSITRDYTAQKIENELSDCMEQIELYEAQLNDYREVLKENKMAELLEKSVQHGQMTLLDYLTYMLQVYESIENYLVLESEYYKLLARLNRSYL